MNDKVPFKLFACCIPVLGIERSLICDLQRKTHHFIPNGLYEILIEYEGKSISEVKLFYDKEYENLIDEYFDFLFKNEYIFFTKQTKLFPALDLHWDYPGKISNAIIDVDEKEIIPFWKDLINELELFGCKNIQIRCFSEKSIRFFNKLLEFFTVSTIENIEILLKYNSILTKSDLINFTNQYSRISSLIIHSAPQNETIYVAPQGMGHVFYISQEINGASHCGIIAPQLFSSNIESFTESQYHNSCLNRKISIDTEGNIKNCPSMSQSFGNIKDTTLQEALDHPDFKKYWNITKDKIHVCKDCEFRYICTDCRAYVENPEDILSKPLKCGYNPYTGEWSEWSTNPLKEKAIAHYGMEELVKKEE